MTVRSFRIDSVEATRVQEMAAALGITQSEMVREALRRHLNSLASLGDAAAYDSNPLSPQELSLMEIQKWAPDEDWSDWHDATR